MSLPYCTTSPQPNPIMVFAPSQGLTLSSCSAAALMLLPASAAGFWSMCRDEVPCMLQTRAGFSRDGRPARLNEAINDGQKQRFGTFLLSVHRQFSHSTASFQVCSYPEDSSKPWTCGRMDLAMICACRSWSTCGRRNGPSPSHGYNASWQGDRTPNKMAYCKHG